jgi:hypothetical protein
MSSKTTARASKSAAGFAPEPRRNVDASVVGAYTVQDFASGNGRNRCAGIFLGGECVENFHARDFGAQYLARAKARAQSLNEEGLRRALEFAAELRANVDAWYAVPSTPVTYAAFSARNGETWRKVREAGVVVELEVSRILRETR